MLRHYYTQVFTMSNNRNFYASKEEPRSGKFDGTISMYMYSCHYESDCVCMNLHNNSVIILTIVSLIQYEYEFDST